MHPKRSKLLVNNIDSKSRAFFYFRSPDYRPEAVSEEERHLYEPQKGENGKKLATLKARFVIWSFGDREFRIRESKLPLQENYNNPQQFGDFVLQDLSNVILQVCLWLSLVERNSAGLSSSWRVGCRAGRISETSWFCRNKIKSIHWEVSFVALFVTYVSGRFFWPN